MTGAKLRSATFGIVVADFLCGQSGGAGQCSASRQTYHEARSVARVQVSLAARRQVVIGFHFRSGCEVAVNTSIKSRAGTLPQPPVAAIVHEQGDQADAALADLVSALKASGWRVRGLMQPPHGADGEKCPYLIDIDEAGARYFIFQALGSEACACGLDPGAVAEASAVLRRALQQGADLVLANRFGTLESSGGGLAAEMLALMLEAVPLLTVVNRRYLEAWRAFTGGTAAELEPTAESLQAWVAGLQAGVGRA